jgi:sugar O-acyltransferase (sialic acid O-acetyltransferase NeuD family)
MHAASELVIVGAGGFGMEVICWAEDASRAGSLPPIRGYLLDAQYPRLDPQYGLPWLGALDDYVPLPGDACLLAVSDSGAKRAMVARLKARGARFSTLVHPTAIVARTAQLGEGCIVCPFATLSAGVAFGDFVTLNAYSGIGHRSRIGAYSTLSSHVDITGDVIVGESVFFGSGARVLPGLTVGDDAKVGAGAVVMRSVRAGVTVYTAPAKKLC